MTLLRRGATGLLLALLLVPAGCGDDGLKPASRDRLGERIADAREALGSDDAAGVRRALIAFRRDVRAARERGEITAERADRLLRGALQASRRVRAEITPEPTATVAPAPTAVAPAAPTPQDVAKPDDEAEGEGEGEGEGQGEGQGEERGKKRGKEKAQGRGKKEP
jgi:hypothetical protein